MSESVQCNHGARVLSLALSVYVVKVVICESFIISPHVSDQTEGSHFCVLFWWRVNFAFGLAGGQPFTPLPFVHSSIVVPLIIPIAVLIPILPSGNKEQQQHSHCFQLLSCFSLSSELLFLARTNKNKTEQDW